MFYGQPWFTFINIGRMIFSLVLLALVIIIPIVIYNLGSKLDKINQKLDYIGELLRTQQKA